jgi:hypothetical protein
MLQVATDLDASIAPARLKTFNIGKKGLDDSYARQWPCLFLPKAAGFHFLKFLRFPQVSLAVHTFNGDFLLCIEAEVGQRMDRAVYSQTAEKHLCTYPDTSKDP